MYTALNENETELHQRVFDDHETIPKLPGAFERVQQPMMIHVSTCFGLVGGCFEHLL
jgi:hypothetical protein